MTHKELFAWWMVQEKAEKYILKCLLREISELLRVMYLWIYEWEDFHLAHDEHAIDSLQTWADALELTVNGVDFARDSSGRTIERKYLSQTPVETLRVEVFKCINFLDGYGLTVEEGRRSGVKLLIDINKAAEIAKSFGHRECLYEFHQDPRRFAGLLPYVDPPTFLE